jgi:hypothetical protein
LLFGFGTGRKKAPHYPGKSTMGSEEGILSTHRGRKGCGRTCRTAVPFFQVFRCLTDSGAVIGSGAVKDDFPVFRNSFQSRLELGQGDRPFQLNLPAGFFVAVCADQKGFPRCDVLRVSAADIPFGFVMPTPCLRRCRLARYTRNTCPGSGGSCLRRPDSAASCSCPRSSVSCTS